MAVTVGYTIAITISEKLNNEECKKMEDALKKTVLNTLSEKVPSSAVVVTNGQIQKKSAEQDDKNKTN